MTKKLVDLEPKWTASPGRHGMGIHFLCPCGCDRLYGAFFANPLDGGPPFDQGEGWERTGDTFETLTLSPSLLFDRGHWHGWLKDGVLTSC